MKKLITNVYIKGIKKIAARAAKKAAGLIASAKRSFIRTALLIAIIALLGTVGFFLPHGYFNSGKADIYIHITGAVKSPGIYPVPYGGTIQDAVDAAGGTLPGADLSNLDPAKKLTEAQAIYID